MSSTENSSVKQTSSQEKAIAIYQIVGGVLGLVITILFVFGSPHISSIVLVSLLFPVLLYGFSLFCGFTLYRSGNIFLSVINQLLQIVFFSVDGILAYKYFSGAYFSLGINLLSSNLQVNFGISTWEFGFGAYVQGSNFSLNLVAIFLLFRLGRIKKQLARQQMEEKFT